MKIIGASIVLLSVLGVLISLNMSAAVYSEGNGIYNTGMLNDRTNYVIVSCCGCIVGVLLFLGGIMQEIKDVISKNSQD